MFTAKDPQHSLFETSMVLPKGKRRRIEKTWAWAFRAAALPLIDEEAFRDFYSADNGRPNKPVQTVIGILLLKEMFDLTDDGALGALEFDLRWQVALDLEPDKAHCCQKTLHNFRAKLMKSEKGRLLFEGMTSRIIEALETKTERQRLDSTHIMSNIAILTRLGLFCETARVFLKELRRRSRKKFGPVPEGLRRRYLKDDGTDTRYHDAPSAEARRRISVCARDVWRLVDRFKGDKAVEKLQSYALLKRLLDEQCEIVEDPPGPKADDADVNDPPAPVVVKEAKKVSSDSLQSPHDADATYSGRKGKGHEVQIAETCGNGDKPEMITHAEVTRSCESDEKATVPTVDSLASRGIQPNELLADTNYGSAENAIACEKKGTELVCPVPGPKPGSRDTGEEKGAAEDRNADEDEASTDPREACEAPEAHEASEGHEDGQEKITPEKITPEKITKTDFDVDPKGERTARCPAGREAVSEKRNPGTGRIRAFFDGGICSACNMRDSCPAKPLRDGRRVLRTTVRAAVAAIRRRYEKTEEFKARYAERAGIEATNSELKRAHGLGRLRIRGFLRVRLAVYLKALACNVKRMVKYLVRRAVDAARLAPATA